MDKENVEQDQGRDPVQEETEGIEKERPIHIQITNGKDKTEVKRSVQKKSAI